MCSQHAEGPNPLLFPFLQLLTIKCLDGHKNVKLSHWRMVTISLNTRMGISFFHVYSMKVVTHTHVVLPFDVVIDR